MYMEVCLYLTEPIAIRVIMLVADNISILRIMKQVPWKL